MNYDWKMKRKSFPFLCSFGSCCLSQHRVKLGHIFWLISYAFKYPICSLTFPLCVPFVDSGFQWFVKSVFLTGSDLLLILLQFVKIHFSAVSVQRRSVLLSPHKFLSPHSFQTLERISFPRVPPTSFTFLNPFLLFFLVIIIFSCFFAHLVIFIRYWTIMAVCWCLLNCVTFL